MLISSQDMQLALTKGEKGVLFRKYKGEGLSSTDADIKLKSMRNYLRTFVLRLQKNKKLKEVDINKRFREEFEKLCMRY